MILLGTSNSFDSGVVHHGPLRIWAERGLIHVEDSRDNDYRTFSVATVLRRMRGISEMLGNSTDRDKYTESQFDRAWRERNQTMIEEMIEVIRRAKEQGMPSDPTAVRDLVRRAPKTIVVPAYGGGM